MTVTDTCRKAISVEIRDSIAIVSLNLPGSKVNSLGAQFQEEIKDVVDLLHTHEDIKASVIISTKTHSFIAGADINMLSKSTSKEQISDLASYAQHLYAKIEQNTDRPVVVAIHGNCLGAGLELALSCHYRVATNHPKTLLGLPEVMIGLLPGAGGTQRLPRLIGLTNALPLILTGSNCRAGKALDLGLVDELINPPCEDASSEEITKCLEKAAVDRAKKLANGELKRRPDIKDGWSLAGLWKWMAHDVWFVRDYVLKKARDSVMAKTCGNYPAPLTALDVVRIGLEMGMEEGLRVEAEMFGQLSQTSEAKSLMSLFFAQTALKKNRFQTDYSRVNSVERIAVVGDGELAAGVSYSSVVKGIDTVLVHSGNAEGTGNSYCIDFVKDMLRGRLARKAITVRERDQIMSRLHNASASSSENTFNHCQMVVESSDGDLEARKGVVRDLEEGLPVGCVYGIATSAHLVSEVSEVCKRPENVIGVRYLNPMVQVSLLELIINDKTSLEVKRLAVDIGLKQGKTVVVVKDSPGFYTARVMNAVMCEVLSLLEEGVTVRRIDECMTRFGFTTGPIALADLFGLDVIKSTSLELEKVYGSRMCMSRAILNEMIRLGFTGRKCGTGFYLYSGIKASDTPTKENQRTSEVLESFVSQNGGESEVTNEDIQLRIMLRLVYECVWCLQDKVLERQDGNMGAVVGLGFPPFLGGPFHYIENKLRGDGAMLRKIEEYEKKYGERFKPCQTLLELLGEN